MDLDVKKISISPCPNDIFMFHAMLEGLVDCEGLHFEPTILDIEELNRAVIGGETDVSKVSYAVVPKVLRDYAVLRSGSALGYGCGPIVVAREEMSLDAIGSLVVAVPGALTTANMLLETLLDVGIKRKYYRFDKIQDAVLSGECDAGVLIHEERFSFGERGLKKVADLGVEWEKEAELPLPLGGIVVSRELDYETQTKINRVIRRSIEYAFANPMASRKMIKQNAQSLSDEVIDSHIAMFVNEFSIDIGVLGRRAVMRLLADSVLRNPIFFDDSYE